MTREEATNLLYRLKFFFDHTRKRGRYSEQLAKALGMAIESLQTDIVRCKDCKNNYNTCTNHGTNQPMCDFTDRMLKETDFCSRGERREP